MALSWLSLYPVFVKGSRSSFSLPNKVQFCLFLLVIQRSTGVFVINASDHPVETIPQEVVPTFSQNTDLFQTYERFETQGEAVVLSSHHLEDMGETTRAESSPAFTALNNKIVLIPLELHKDAESLCGKKRDSWEEAACSYAVVCSLRPLAIVQEIAGYSWSTPKRWFSDQGREILVSNRLPGNCSHFSLTVAQGVFSELSNGTYLSSRLVVEDSSLDGLRSAYSVISFIFFRVISSTCYVGLTVLSIAFFVIRYRRGKLNSIYVLLYLLTAITCSILAAMYYLGPFALFDIISPQHERLQFGTIDSYLGVSCSTDYLSTILYTHTVAKIGPVQPQLKSRKWLIQMYPIMSTFGIAGAFLNLLLSLRRSSGAMGRNEKVGSIARLFLGSLQLAVLVYVWIQIRRVTTKLQQSRSSSLTKCGISTNGTKLSPQEQLEKQMRFWVKVSAVGTLVTLFALLVLPWREKSRLDERITASVLTVGKQMNTFAQLMISRPVKSQKQQQRASTERRNRGKVVPQASTQQSSKDINKELPKDQG